MSSIATIDYTIRMKTGEMLKAGTDSKVYMQLYGANDTVSDVFDLRKYHRKGTNNKCFQRKSLDEFELNNVRDIGELEEVIIWHDSQGVFSDWYLEWVEVIAQGTERKKYNFSVNKWIGGKYRDNEVTLRIGA